MRLPVNALQVFATVYAEGGIRPASRVLGIAHSSVSRHLKELDAWLGTPLISEPAGRRGITFTAAGDALGRATVAGLRDIAQAVAALREVRSPHSVTLSTTASIASRWLLPRLPRLAQQHPQIELSVRVQQSLDSLQADDIDLALRMGQGPWPGLACEPLMDDTLAPLASRAYLDTCTQPDAPATLADMRLLHDQDLQAAWELWRKAIGPATLDSATGPRFTSSDLVLRAAALGQGIALGRLRLAAEDITKGALLRPFGALQIVIPDAYWLVRPLRARKRVAVDIVVRWMHEAAALA